MFFIDSDLNRAHLHGMAAAVIALTCKELKNETAELSVRLRYAYADALEAAGRATEAMEWFAKCAELDRDEVTDARQRSTMVLSQNIEMRLIATSH